MLLDASDHFVETANPKTGPMSNLKATTDVGLANAHVLFDSGNWETAKSLRHRRFASIVAVSEEEP
ncbi:MAG: hypothetical protein QM296_00375 [Bacillota bacterium]|nr:hypothetical protein [Bacillota bacterium]